MLQRFTQALRRSLLIRLAGFYLLISLPTLLLVEIAVLSVEFGEFTRAADAGLLLQAVNEQAERLGAPGTASSDARTLARELAAWLQVLERPQRVRQRRGRDVMRELSAEPLRAVLLDANGQVWVSAEGSAMDADWPVIAQAQWPSAAVEIARAGQPEWLRRYAVPVAAGSERRPALLLLEVRLPLPWRRALFRTGIEWPVLFASLLVFVLGTLLFFNGWVTRRLHRIAAAADAWRAGRFTQLIGDRSGDELGQLSARLDRMAGDLQELVSARARLAQLDERQRLARDLHDTVKQKAFALSLQLAAARAGLGQLPPSARSGLDEAATLAGEIQHELAQILDQLDDPDASAGSFAERLSARLTAWSRRSGIQLLADLAGADRVAPTHQDNLLRLIDEALANVQRHSGASQVDVRLHAQGQTLCLRIADDGRGLDPAHVPGRGLANLQQRAQALPGGRLALDDQHGVAITLSFHNEPE